MANSNNFNSHSSFIEHQGLQPSQHDDQNALRGATTSSQFPPALQNQNQVVLANSNSYPADLHVDNSQFSYQTTYYQNLDDSLNNGIGSDDAYAQMMHSDELLESEQYALAMDMAVVPEKTQHEEYDDDDNNNNSENLLENQFVGIEPLAREVLEGIGNPPSDGENWRKYGQKNIRGTKFPRSYYKCTHPDCKVMKKVEYSAEGYAVEIIYKGVHDHPQANPSCDLVSVYLAQALAYNLDGQDNYDSRERMLDRYVATAQMSSSSRSARQQKSVAITESRHGVLDDGYRWRKYGKKIVKGNSDPRSYYKCTYPGCIVRKHIERATYDHNLLLTTYEGNHNHGLPTTKQNNNNNQANNLQLVTRVEAPIMPNQERFMRFECPNPLNTVNVGTINVDQYPRPN